MKRIMGFLFIVIGLACIAVGFNLPNGEETVPKKGEKLTPPEPANQTKEETTDDKKAATNNDSTEKWKDSFELTTSKVNYTFDDSLSIIFTGETITGNPNEKIYSLDISIAGKKVNNSSLFFKYLSGNVCIYKIKNIYFILSPSDGQFGDSKIIIVVNSNGELVKTFNNSVINETDDVTFKQDATKFKLHQIDWDSYAYDENIKDYCWDEYYYEFEIIDNGLKEIKKEKNYTCATDSG